MNRIANVLLLLLLTSSLSGCASLFSFWKSEPEVKPIEVITKPAEKTPLAIKPPAPLKLPQVGWVILTKENANEVLSNLEKSGKDPVIFGLSDEGYQDLSIMFSEIRNFISSQQIIILQYQDYYEPKSPEVSK